MCQSILASSSISCFLFCFLFRFLFRYWDAVVVCLGSERDRCEWSMPSCLHVRREENATQCHAPNNRSIASDKHVYYPLVMLLLLWLVDVCILASTGCSMCVNCEYWLSFVLRSIFSPMGFWIVSSSHRGGLALLFDVLVALEALHRNTCFLRC